MIKIGIIGGAGYTAGELLRILVFHPSAQIVFVHSNSNTGKAVADFHAGMVGDTDLKFCDDMPFDKVDVIFLCQGHGQSTSFFAENSLPSHVKVIDLSMDFRINGNHEFVYGLPELQREKIKSSKYIANPGCFATAVQLALLPLAAKNLLNSEVHINAVTGSTGAGQKPTATTHFSWRSNNVSSYKPFEHQHLAEIGQSLTQLQSNFDQSLTFVPVRGSFTRGILAMVYVNCDLEIGEAKQLYADFYKGDPFVFQVAEEPDVKQIVNTNKCIYWLKKHDGKLLIITAIDNLLKGASGQAVQNMNLMFGLNENEGLRLKATGF